ncbi:sulfite exporter TauE/SafE family protein [Hyphobacterium sp. CCMP332]|nr:sulfite exporter TauE/SafE family protein [Hyphobacterium sp. CCMP332]
MLIAALTMGFLGSAHCIGMCGPLALAMPYGRFGGFRTWLARIVYQSGRLSTYFFLGLILGFIGFSFNLAGIQQYFSIGLGVMLIMVLFIPMLFRNSLFMKRYYLFENWVKKNIGNYINQNKISGFYITGILNGLLPCGLVWLALISAIALGNGIESALFMLFFGLGTLPALVATMISYQAIQKRFTFSYKKVSSAITLVIALLLIVRGLNMGNYFSPYLDFDTAKEKIITICGFDD